jgi:hypothetical protein
MVESRNGCDVKPIGLLRLIGWDDVHRKLFGARVCGHGRMVSVRYEISPLGVIAHWRCADCGHPWRSVGSP